jgi:hypothetical protein
MLRTPTRFILAAVVASTSMLSSCDLPIDFWVDKTTNVNIPTGDMTTVTQAPQTVNLNDYPAVAGQAKLIKSVQIPEVWIEVTSIDPTNTATQVSGTLSITDPTDSTFAPVMLTYTNIPIVAGGRLDLTPQASDVTRLQTLLQTKGSCSITYSASIDQLPAVFSLQGELHLIATVSVGS